MRHYYFIFQFILLPVMAFAQQQISFLNEQITFYVPEEIILTKLEDENMSLYDYKIFYEKKMSVRPTIVEEDDFLNMTGFDKAYSGFSDELIDLVESGKFSRPNLFTLLIQHNDSSAFRRGPGIITSSYAKIEYNGETIGELYGYDGSIDEVAPLTYGYWMNLISGNNILCIEISMHDVNFIIPPRMPEYFYYKNIYKNYVWQDFSMSRSMLYHKLNKYDYEGLPEEFKKLRETLDMIVNTLVIKGYENENPTGAVLRFANPELSFDPSQIVKHADEKEEDNIKIISDGGIKKGFDNKILSANGADVASANKSGKTKLWLILLLFVPLLSVAVFFVIRKRKRT